MVGMFGVAPLAVAYTVHGRWVIPAILLLGLVCLVVMLGDKTFNRRELWSFRGVGEWGKGTRAGRPIYGGILARVILVGGAMLVALWLWAPDRIFGLIRERPEIWAIIMVGYPLLSAYPQELAFRVYFRHRFRELFQSEAAYLLVNASVFGMAHLIMHNWLAVLLSTGAGLVLAWSFERSRSCAAVWIEHALYGCAIFTIGWGWWFYGGAVGR